MPRRQHPRWLFTDERLGDPVAAARRLGRGAGIVVRHHHLAPGERRELVKRLRMVALRRGLALVDEADGAVARVHDARELRRALGRGAAPLFISALFPTRSHPGRAPLPRMRAATLARLAKGRALALGGMDEKRYRAVARLGFCGWGAIDGWSIRI